MRRGCACRTRLCGFDVAWRDHRVHRNAGTVKVLGVCIAIGVALVALPFGLGEWLLANGHPIGAILVGLSARLACERRD